MKILFLRVGIDRGCGGRLSPISADGKFEYIPIPERAAVQNGLRYSDIVAREGGTLAQLIGTDGFAHLDPEFVTHSYGEPSHPKRAQLLSLTKGDFLVFYAGFQGEGIAIGTCCAIGYFTVKTVHAMNSESEWPPLNLIHLNNAHFRRARREDSLVVVEGNQQGSRLLTHAVPISDASQRVLPTAAGALGFSGSVMRAVGRWVPSTHIKSALTWMGEWN